MGISLQLTSSLKVKDKAIPIDPQRICQRMTKWAQERYPTSLLQAWSNVHDGGCVAWFNFHDAGEPVGIDVQHTGTVVASADSTAVGPGYHAHVCEFLDELGGEFKIAWPRESSDETFDDSEYYFLRDQAALERVFIGWVGSLAKTLTQQEAKEYAGLAIKMPLEYGFDYPADLLTCSGPRSFEWARRVAAFPRQGQELFPWWERHWSARHDLNLALCNMWMNIRWAPPMEQQDSDLLSSVLRCLREAHEGDPTMEFPWAEWAELLDIAEFAELPAENAKLAAKVRKNAEGKVAQIGYRRHGVWYRDLPGGWSINVPGSMTTQWEDDGGTWVAFDSSRSVRFSSMSITPGPGALPPTPSEVQFERPPGASAPIEWSDEGRGGCGFTAQDTNEDGQKYHLLSGTTCCGWEVGFCTVCFDSVEDREWAVRVWKSARVVGAVRQA